MRETNNGKKNRCHLDDYDNLFFLFLSFVKRIQSTATRVPVQRDAGPFARRHPANAVGQSQPRDGVPGSTLLRFPYRLGSFSLNIATVVQPCQRFTRVHPYQLNEKQRKFNESNRIF